MKTENYAPMRFNKVFHWIAALDAFDYCDPEPLEQLLRGDETIPPEVRSALADILGGKRKPNKKAAAKLKVPATERMKIAGSISAVLSVIDVIKYGGTDGTFRRALEIAAERRRREPVEVLRSLEAEARNFVAESAAELGVSVETIEVLLRDLREKIRKFPIV